ncbi:LPXTG cell wall anchor domain-containing protein [Streptococcus mutans]|uniref:LPXTG cell wall anchor domain-containing protein n=1 Tax=Streptococcus mutans TaxID=1309 RepID=UPI0028EB0565|nr:LPXTG cell wall anchor domain-containing protein [Streptococcus mutans]MDT9501231.1 LPXTG cell wall anchor domain-containing protein [Streptococcus mutans]
MKKKQFVTLMAATVLVTASTGVFADEAVPNGQPAESIQAVTPDTNNVGDSSQAASHADNQAQDENVSTNTPATLAIGSEQPQAGNTDSNSEAVPSVPETSQPTTPNSDTPVTPSNSGTDDSVPAAPASPDNGNVAGSDNTSPAPSTPNNSSGNADNNTTPAPDQAQDKQEPSSQVSDDSSVPSSSTEPDQGNHNSSNTAASSDESGKGQGVDKDDHQTVKPSKDMVATPSNQPSAEENYNQGRSQAGLTSDGKMKTLPNTGDAASIFYTFTGFAIMLLNGLFFWKKFIFKKCS